MKKILIILFFTTANYAQISLSAGMGIDFKNSFSLKDYINFLPTADKLNSFTPVVDFYTEGSYEFSEHIELGFEHVYSIFSYNSNLSSIGLYRISYNLHKPTVLIFYYLKGEGYKFRFGGGVGYRFVSLNDQLPNSSKEINYGASGVGLNLRTEGFTSLGGNFYAQISLSLSCDILGDLKSDELDKFLLNPTTKENVNLDSFSSGVRLGVSYNF